MIPMRRKISHTRILESRMPDREIAISQLEEEVLTRIVLTTPELPVARHARALLLFAAGWSGQQVAEELAVAPSQVDAWRAEFERRRPARTSPRSRVPVAAVIRLVRGERVDRVASDV